MNARNMTSRLFAGVAAAVLAVAAPSASAAEKVTVGQVTSITLTFAPVIMAQGMGFFEEEGLEVEIIPFKGSATLLPQIVSKRITVGYPNPDILIISRQPGKDEMPLKFFYNMTRESAWEIAVPADSPIRSIADLKGKKLGVGALTWGNIPITRAMLKDVGVDPDKEIELVPVGVGAPAFRALTTGQVDALNLFDVQHAMLEESGTAIRRLELPPKYANLFSNGFIAHEDTIRDDAETLGAFGRAVAKGTVACEANPRGCVLNFWQHYPNQRPTEGSEEEQIESGIRIMRARFDKTVRFAPGQEALYGAYPREGWQDFIETLFEGGQISTTEIDIDRLYTNELVDAFNRFDREAVVQAAKAFEPR